MITNLQPILMNWDIKIQLFKPQSYRLGFFYCIIIKTEDIMKKELQEILTQISETKDPDQIHDLIESALEMDSHDPVVLLLAAEFSHDPYERLSLLDHSIRHLEHHLHEDGYFDENEDDDNDIHPIENILAKSVELRFNTFMDLNYYHQAMHEYIQLLSLNEDTPYADERAMIACLYTGHTELAQEIYEGYEVAPFSVSFPYAISLYNEGEETEAIGLFENLLDFVPSLKGFIGQLVHGETPMPQTEEDYAVLNVLFQTASMTPVAFIEIAHPHHH